ncbi:hypothetical protein MJO28_011191 [Puccinia striiformis f. sp. tritici]|uniref:Secreted protein n=3 Tax=Puccinia striiformis TaxID=27350 RepID=A0A2S4UY21_9BASI|nr:hypothetical protein MJO28_011191 [Puccinia striiformis f. sp. tritici]KAI7946454.1 hypothetical protein MJO29_010981 [Puccinia striiformis f. sp. tritici]POW02150.1 hypothetical protein PSTT_11988 [Puccinia striiformis]
MNTIIAIFSSWLLMSSVVTKAPLPGPSDVLNMCKLPSIHKVPYCVMALGTKRYFPVDAAKEWGWPPDLFTCNNQYVALCCRGVRRASVTDLKDCLAADRIDGSGI